MKRCRACIAGEVETLLDFGPQPIANRYTADPAEEEEKHPLTLGQCLTCGLVQLVNPAPVEALVPPYDWITYREPEEHLDDMAGIVTALPGIDRESVLCGLSYKDDSTLDRLKRAGYENLWRVDPQADLGRDGAKVEIETIQDLIGPETVPAMRRNHPPPDVILARHILEHTHDTARFMSALENLGRRKCYMVFESPDCERAFDHFDYSILWEEHVLYFTPVTFRGFFPRYGLVSAEYRSYPYPFEHSLVGMVRRADGASEPAMLSGESLEKERGRALNYAREFHRRKERYRSFLAGRRREKGKIALLGAGHLSCTFLNLFGLKDLVEFVVDDNREKQGLYMPGSGLPIRPSGDLIEEGIKLCLLGVGAGVESRVVDNNRPFLEKGGVFESIFPLSERSLDI